jgi:purine-binding chemotaxis protein CheW
MAVHATLSDPAVQASVLARGHCRGVIPYAGRQVPAVDLMALCGLGRLGEHGPRQAFVMQLPAGMVAFLVEKVLDVVRTRPADLIAVPACALARPALFAGALPASQPAVGDTRNAGTGSIARLVLDSTALRSDETVASLAATNTALPDAGTLQGVAAPGSRTAAAWRDMLTYEVGGESATPLEQVAEILPYSADLATFDADRRMLGVLVHRGRSVPVLCLSRLLTGRAADITPVTSVLVVEAGGELMGFVVPALKAIEPAAWEPELPALGLQGSDEFTQATQARKLALVGSGANERMLPVLDLKRIARSIQEQRAAA